MAQNWQLQQLTSSGWRTIAEGSREEVNQKFQECLLSRGRRRVLDARGTQTIHIAMGQGSFVQEVRS